MPAPSQSWVKLGVITGPHGVAGRLKVKSFSEHFADYTEFTDEEGKSVRLTIEGGTDDAPIVRIEGVNDRNEAERWRGVSLGTAREKLKEIDEPHTYYVTDLIGMEVVDAAGKLVGSVKEVMNFGAGDIIEISFEGGGSEMFTFTRVNFPNVDQQARRITFQRPEVIGSRDEEDHAA